MTSNHECLYLTYQQCMCRGESWILARAGEVLENRDGCACGDVFLVGVLDAGFFEVCMLKLEGDESWFDEL